MVYFNCLNNVKYFSLIRTLNEHFPFFKSQCVRRGHHLFPNTNIKASSRQQSMFFGKRNDKAKRKQKPDTGRRSQK